jgi:hypothetical protein
MIFCQWESVPLLSWHLKAIFLYSLRLKAYSCERFRFPTGSEEILPYVSGEAARKMYQTGDLKAGTISISQGIGIPKKIMPVRDIIAEIIGQAQTIHKRMAKIGMA